MLPAFAHVLVRFVHYEKLTRLILSYFSFIPKEKVDIVNIVEKNIIVKREIQ